MTFEMTFKTVSREELGRLLAMAAALYEMDHGDMTPEQDIVVHEVTLNALDLLFPNAAEGRDRR